MSLKEMQLTRASRNSLDFTKVAQVGARAKSIERALRLAVAVLSKMAIRRAQISPGANCRGEGEPRSRNANRYSLIAND
jgi:hypothetical protein